jgi:hypothetical protein
MTRQDLRLGAMQLNGRRKSAELFERVQRQVIVRPGPPIEGRTRDGLQQMAGGIIARLLISSAIGAGESGLFLLFNFRPIGVLRTAIELG